MLPAKDKFNIKEWAAKAAKLSSYIELQKPERVSHPIYLKLGVKIGVPQLKGKKHKKFMLVIVFFTLMVT